MVSTKKADEILKNAAVYYPKLYNNAWTVKPTKLYGYPCFKYGDWRVIRKIPAYWGEYFAMVTHKNMFVNLVSEAGQNVGFILIKRSPQSKDYDLDIGYRGIYTPKQVISLIQTPISRKDRHWILSMSNFSGSYPQRVDIFLKREV